MYDLDDLDDLFLMNDEYPPIPDWVETEMEYRTRPEGY